MQRSHCSCPFSRLQQLAVSLSQDTLPFDNILQIGSEVTGRLTTTINCERCIITKRMANILSQVTSRLVCYYEAAYLSAATNPASTMRIRSISEASFLTTHLSQHGRMSPPQSPTMGRTPGCQSVAREMKLGELSIDGSEARMLVEVVLVDACSDLNQKLQDWKVVMDDLLDSTEEQHLVQYDAIISRCLDRLAKLIGLLQLDGLSVERP